MEKKVVTRFAPSPTGFLHIGGVRTAIFAYLWAKKNHGEFILRIEDTDKEREVDGSISHIVESLKWIGLDWDYGPDKPGPFGSCIQSERLESYKPFTQKLIDKGLAYPDPYTQEQVEEFRKKAEEEKRPFLFRNYRPEKFDVWDGKKPLRFKVPEIKKYKWHDIVRGDLEAGEEALDDFILIKSDGYPTYNFAHIIDDYLMNVTHILRADEFISSTPKFLSLYEALEIEPPKFATLPPIMGPDGKKKLSKRDGAKDILEYRDEGILPVAMFNFLSLIGWNPGGEKEVFSVQEIVDVFTLDRIQKSGGAFNEEKLGWMNKEHLKLLPFEEKCQQVSKALSINDEGFIKKITPVVIDRISKWSDIETLKNQGELDYFIGKPNYDSSLLRWKDTDLNEAKEHLVWVKDKLSSLDESVFDSVETIKSAVFDYATEKGRGNVLWPLRVSLSGKEKSPDPFTLIYILGKDESLDRINTAISKI
jgi:glutamyl-tRNA synthetase